MIRPATVAKALAFGLAIAAHGALALALMAPQETAIDGAGGAAEVRLGSSFADMVAGRQAALRADTRAETPPIAQTAPDTPATAISPERAASAATRQAEAAPRAEPAITPAARAEIAEALPGSATVAALRPDAALPPDAEQPLRAETVARQDPIPAEPLTSGSPQSARTAEEALTAEAETSPAITRSLRPKPRSPEFVAAHAPPPQPAPRQQTRESTQKPDQPAPAGNAQQNARAGSATGKESAKATQSGANGSSQAAGNAAASNYPGLVMRKLSRAGKPRVNARGAAVVAFSIAGSGALASVTLARSSGSGALDRAAVQLVRSASPFPKPPQGARRSFSIQIKGR